MVLQVCHRLLSSFVKQSSSNKQLIKISLKNENQCNRERFISIFVTWHRRRTTKPFWSSSYSSVNFHEYQGVFSRRIEGIEWISFIIYTCSFKLMVCYCYCCFKMTKSKTNNFMKEIFPQKHTLTKDELIK